VYTSRCRNDSVIATSLVANGRSASSALGATGSDAGGPVVSDIVGVSRAVTNDDDAKCVVRHVAGNGGTLTSSMR
jgi:hypothetical protein